MFFRYLVRASFGHKISSSTNNKTFKFSKSIALCIQKAVTFPFHLNVLKSHSQLVGNWILIKAFFKIK